MPNIYKIGRTARNPYERVKELSKSTSCPVDFEMICFAEFDDCLQAEKQAHEQFRDYRVNENKEFFKFSVTDLITYACYSICEPVESGCLDSSNTKKFDYFLDLFMKDIEYA